MGELSRRQLLAGSAVVALGAAAAPALAGCSHHSDAAATGHGDWVELETAMKETTLDGHKVRLRAYNGKIPGPLIEARPGDTLRIRLKNSLPPYDSSKWTGDHNVPHGLDATNLHVHGLDVVPHIFEPVGTSDPLAPQIVVGPGETKEYVFELPGDHPPGFNFYHPHKHGSTSVQVGSGLAGPIIVRGAIDEVPEIKAAREIVLAVQDIGLFPSEDDPNVWQYLPVQNAIWQTFGGFVTIFGKRTTLRGGFTTGDYALHYFLLNGEPFFKEEHDYTPGKEIEPKGTQLPVQRFTIAPGEVIRFRMLNGATDNMMPIVVDGHDMYLTAMDGVNFPETRVIPAREPADSTEQVLVATGNRADFLIKGNANPGIYRIRQLAQSAQFLKSDEKIIAEIEVTGPPKNMALPTKLPIPSRFYPLIKPEEVKRVRMIEFMSSTPGMINLVTGGDYLVNNAIYNEQEVPVVTHLDDVEEWWIKVGTGHPGGDEGHPFHIHVNSFEVISVDGKPVPPGTIQDTVWVGAGQTVVIRQRYKQHVGKSVFHCHILPHEDTGMMANFLILPPGDDMTHMH
jgi:suppressor of ftsI